MPTAIERIGVTAGDVLCLQFLAESGRFSDADVHGVRAWWEAGRHGSECLVAFLVRNGVFFDWTVEELALIERGYVSAV